MDIAKFKYCIDCVNIYSYSPNCTCLCEPQLGYCTATYYSTKTRLVPACKKCINPTDLDCLKRWSSCVKRKDKAAYGVVSSVVNSVASYV